MNHPYLYPDEAPWTEDYQDLMQVLHNNRQLALFEQDESGDYGDYNALFPLTPLH